MWFKTLTGFDEQSPEQVRQLLRVEGDEIVSTVNNHRMNCGRLEIVSLAKLRTRAASAHLPSGRLQLGEIVADVQHLHTDTANTDALFQVASQFNLLEMISPSVTPEDGIGIYEHDRTQGPACAIAAGAGTIYRNYFAELNGRIGQSNDHQIDCLQGIGQVLGNLNEELWTMRNGYALPTEKGLRRINDTLASMNDYERNTLRDELQIGIQWNTQVTLEGCGHLVSQAFCSALPVAYSPHASELWEPFARLILEAAYEATLCAARINAAQTGNRNLFLTLLGGGAFGNDNAWISDAIERALQLCPDVPLNVAIVSYGTSKPGVRDLIARVQE